jgi:dienelactone hydrolase
MAWLANHGSDKTRPPLDKVIAALKEQGVTKFGATGYCFGGTSPHPIRSSSN